MPDFGGGRRNQEETAGSTPLRQEQLKKHEEQLRGAAERARRDRGSGVRKMLGGSPGGSIARGLEKEAYVMGTPFEDAVVRRAAEDLAFGVRQEPTRTNEAERDLALAAAAAKAEVEQRAVAAAQAEVTQKILQDMTAREEANRRAVEQLSLIHI